MSATKTKPTLTGPQYRALKALAHKRMSRRELADAAFNGNSVNFVPILGPLEDAKLVKQIELGGDPEITDQPKETIFEITKKGREVAKAAPAIPARGKANANHAALPKPGGTIVREFKGKEYKVVVQADGTFKIGTKVYGSLTAAAKAVRGTEQEVNGWAFFNLTKEAK